MTWDGWLLLAVLALAAALSILMAIVEANATVTNLVRRPDPPDGRHQQ